MYLWIPVIYLLLLVLLSPCDRLPLVGVFMFHVFMFYVFMFHAFMFHVFMVRPSGSSPQMSICQGLQTGVDSLVGLVPHEAQPCVIILGRARTSQHCESKINSVGFRI